MSKLTASEILLAISVLHDDDLANRKGVRDVFGPVLLNLSKDELVEMCLTLSERFCDAMAAARDQMELVAITEFKMHPHEAEKLNLPTMAGSIAGLNLPRVDESKCCETCAFRQGTPANQCPGTMADVRSCLGSGETFFCHEGLAFGDQPKKACRGFAQAFKG